MGLPLTLPLLKTVDLAYIWNSQEEGNANMICRIIREMCNDIERQRIFEY
jgi:hypothetical protein